MCHGIVIPSTSAIVGRMSSVVTCRESTTWPSDCPGYLTNSGVKPSSARFSCVGRRRRSPPRKLIPWSGVTITSALSQSPTLCSRAMNVPSSRSV